MTDGWDVAEGDPWSVSCGPNEFTRVVRLRVGDFTIALPALEAHKLGSALHAASGIDAGSELPADEPEPSDHVPDPEMGHDELIGMALSGSARPVEPAGWPVDLIRPDGIEREALEGQHAPEPTRRPDEG